MGREGIAFTFVTPEEGGELTRIEIRIDKLLKRHEVHGFESKLGRPVGTAGSPTQAAADSANAATDGTVAAEDAAPKPTPMFGRGGRPIRRIRRAL